MYHAENFAGQISTAIFLHICRNSASAATLCHSASMQMCFAFADSFQSPFPGPLGCRAGMLLLCACKALSSWCLGSDTAGHIFKRIGNIFRASSQTNLHWAKFYLRLRSPFVQQEMMRIHRPPRAALSKEIAVVFSPAPFCS